MLKYKFKTYYPQFVDRNNIYNTNIYLNGCYLYERRILGNQNFLKINLSNCISFFDISNPECENFNNLINLLNGSILNINNLRLNSTAENSFFISLTNSMFLQKLKKQKELLKQNIYIYNEGKLINFNVPNGATGYIIPTVSSELIEENKNYCNTTQLINNIFKYNDCIRNIEILIEEKNIAINNYDELIFLYLKCALVCAYKAYKYGNLIGCLKNKINGINYYNTWMNSIKKIERFNMSGLISFKNICFFSKNKTIDNVYLNMRNGYFISNFNTYNNLKSIKAEDTLIGMIKQYYQDGVIKYKIIVSNNLLDYFSFLKKNRKNELYTNDYNRLNKVLNAIKSIATTKNIEIEFNDIEKDIYNIEIKVNSDNLVDFLSNGYFNLIPKDVTQAKELMEMHDDILNQINITREIYKNHLFPKDSIFSPLSGATMEEMQKYIDEESLSF
jgi:hypothetical protein